MLFSEPRRRWAALAVVCLGQLMIVLDMTLVNVALPGIQADMRFSQASLTWVLDAYMIAFGSFLLLAASSATSSVASASSSPASSSSPPRRPPAGSPRPRVS